jgi:hypothetical protein
VQPHRKGSTTSDRPGPETLEKGRVRAGLSREELWLRYFELGGRASPLELEAFLEGLLSSDRWQYDIVAHAINERLMELGEIDRLPYAFPGPAQEQDPQ